MGLTDSLITEFNLIQTQVGVSPNETILKELEAFQFKIKQNIHDISKFDQQKFSSLIAKLKEQVSPQRSKFQFKNKFISKIEPDTEKEETTMTTTTSVQRSTSTKIVEHSLQSNVNLFNLKDSVIIYSQISGPVYLENVVNSKVLVNSHQLRLSNCHNLEVYLQRCPQPTIEQSDGIKFFIPLRSKKMLVNDFSWMQSEEASPNYSIISLPVFDEEGLERELVGSA